MTDKYSTLLEFLSFPLNTSDGIFEKFATLPRAVVYGNEPSKFLYVPGIRDDRVVLVAHADTVWRDNDKPEAKHHKIGVERTKQNQTVFVSDSPGVGIGGDDRAGCAIVWLLQNSGHSLLITDGEEAGAYGSNYLINNHKDIYNELQQHRFMLQFDYKGFRNYKCYSVGTDEFRRYVEANTGFSDAGTTAFTDIVALCEQITGANFSIGYHENHTPREYVIYEEWLETLNTLTGWLMKPDLPRFELPLNQRVFGRPEPQWSSFPPIQPSFWGHPKVTPPVDSWRNIPQQDKFVEDYEFYTRFLLKLKIDTITIDMLTDLAADGKWTEFHTFLKGRAGKEYMDYFSRFPDIPRWAELHLIDIDPNNMDLDDMDLVEFEDDIAECYDLYKNPILDARCKRYL